MQFLALQSAISCLAN